MANEFEAVLDNIGCTSDEKQRILQAEFSKIEELFMLVHDEEEWNRFGLRLPIKLALKRIEQVASEFTEDDMLDTGEVEADQNQDKAVKLETLLSHGGKFITAANLISLGARAGTLVDDVALLLATVSKGISISPAALTAGVLIKSSIAWAGAAAIFAFQTVYHTYRFFNGTITWQQLAKYTVVNAVAGGASVGGAVAGAALGTLAFPGIGTIIGAILGGLICGVGAQLLGNYLGNKLVNDDKRFRRAERKKQYKQALKDFGLERYGPNGEHLTREIVDRRRKVLFKKYHPDKQKTEEQKTEATERFLAISAAYFVIMMEKEFISTPTTPADPLLLKKQV